MRIKWKSMLNREQNIYRSTVACLNLCVNIDNSLILSSSFFLFSSGSNRSFVRLFWSINSIGMSLPIRVLHTNVQFAWDFWRNFFLFISFRFCLEFFFFFLYLCLSVYVRWVNILCSLLVLFLERLQLLSLASTFIFLLTSCCSSSLFNINRKKRFLLNVRSSYLMCVAG